MKISARLFASIAPASARSSADRKMPRFSLRRLLGLLGLAGGLAWAPDLAAQVTLQPVEILDVDAAIIFADLLLPVEPMGLRLRFAAGEGPVIDNPVRTSSDIDSLSISNTDDLGYVGETIQLVTRALAGRVDDAVRVDAISRPRRGS